MQQFLGEGHLRWDSLGEFLALAASLDFLSERYEDPKVKILADTLDAATAKLYPHAGIMHAHRLPESLGSATGPGRHPLEDPRPALGIALHDEEGAPISGDVTDQILVWDAGTEIDWPDWRDLARWFWGTVFFHELAHHYVEQYRHRNGRVASRDVEEIVAELRARKIRLFRARESERMREAREGK